MNRLGTGVRLGDYLPGTRDWEDARLRRVGGSDVAALLGLSPWESYFSLWHRKSGTISGPEDNELMLWGRLLEEPIARRFSMNHSEYVVRKCGTYTHRDRDYQLSSPDRLVFNKETGSWEILELKTAYSTFDDSEWGPDGSDEIPLHYRCQVLWALDVFTLPQATMAVFFGGGEYREYTIRYDEADVVILRKYAENFLDTLDRGELPEIDGHTATYRTVRRLHPDIEPRDVDLPEDLAVPYLSALSAAQNVDEAKRRTGAAVLSSMGSARRALWDGRSIATRIPGRNGAPPYLRANPLPKPKKEIT